MHVLQKKTVLCLCPLLMSVQIRLWGRSEDGWLMRLWGWGEDRWLKWLLDQYEGDSRLVGLLDRCEGDSRLVGLLDRYEADSRLVGLLDRYERDSRLVGLLDWVGLLEGLRRRECPPKKKTYSSQ